MKKLHWIPADLPVFDNKQGIIADYTKDFIPEKAKVFWAQKLTEEIDGYHKVGWKSRLTENQKQLASYIDSNLPFDNLVNIKIHHPRIMGDMHIDFAEPHRNKELFLQNRSMEPCGYRMVLAGNRKGDLGVKTSKGIVYPELPESTDWYIIGGTQTPHTHVVVNPERYIVFCHAWINEEQHNQILKQSLEKYYDYAIWDE